MSLECCREALFCRVECLETLGTVAGRSLHGMSLVVVVFLGEELIVYAELLGVAGLRVETLYSKESCRNVETPLYSKID